MSQNGEVEQPRGEIVFYQTDDGKTRIECRFEFGDRRR